MAGQRLLTELIMRSRIRHTLFGGVGRNCRGKDGQSLPPPAFQTALAALTAAHRNPSSSVFDSRVNLPIGYVILAPRAELIQLPSCFRGPLFRFSGSSRYWATARHVRTQSRPTLIALILP